MWHLENSSMYYLLKGVTLFVKLPFLHLSISVVKKKEIKDEIWQCIFAYMWPFSWSNVYLSESFGRQNLDADEHVSDCGSFCWIKLLPQASQDPHELLLVDFIKSVRLTSPKPKPSLLVRKASKLNCLVPSTFWNVLAYAMRHFVLREAVLQEPSFLQPSPLSSS